MLGCAGRSGSVVDSGRTRAARPPIDLGPSRSSSARTRGNPAGLRHTALAQRTGGGAWRSAQGANELHWARRASGPCCSLTSIGRAQPYRYCIFPYLTVFPRTVFLTTIHPKISGSRPLRGREGLGTYTRTRNTQYQILFTNWPLSTTH